MKYCVSSKIMRDFTLEETVKKLQEYNYDGVEWRVHEECHIRPEEVEKKAKYVKQLTESHNLEIVTLVSYVLVEDLDNIKKLFNAANLMKCSRVRLWPPPYDGKENYRQIYQRELANAKKVEKLAEKYRVKIIFEIHPGTIMPSASLAYRWVINFSPQQVGVVFDPGNMVEEGMENWKMGLEILGEYLDYVHCKNAGWFSRRVNGRKEWHWDWLPIKEGIVNWQQVIGILEKRGYDGYLSNEDFREIPVCEKLKGNLKYLKGIVGNQRGGENDIEGKVS